MAAVCGHAVGAVGELAPPDVFGSSGWNLAAARMITSLLAANEADGTSMAWMMLGSGIARAILADPTTVALEADVAFLAANPRTLPAQELLAKTAPHLPADERRLTTFLITALDLVSLSSPRPLPPSVGAQLLVPPRAPPTPVSPIPRRRTRAPGTPPRYSPPRMAIADLSTPPRSSSPQKRSSPGAGSPSKRPAIDVHAWRSGKSGAALFDFDDCCLDERCCSPTELDTPPPSEGDEAAQAKQSIPKPPSFGTRALATSPGRGALLAEETLRPGRLEAEETLRPGALHLQPAWEALSTATILPATQDDGALLKSLSLQPASQPASVEQAGQSPPRLKPRNRSLIPTSSASPGRGSSRTSPRPVSPGRRSTAPTDTDKGVKELALEDYTAVLAERKLRVVLVSSAAMDAAVEGIRASL